MYVRAHVRLVAAVWLTCQVAAFAASPYVLCHDHGVMARMPADHECGKMCPMHHHGQPPATAASQEHHHHQSEAPGRKPHGASLDCRCAVSDAALAGLILETAVLAPPLTIVDELNASRVVIPDVSAPSRPQYPETPPPRA
jgi:hypothetical protein